MTVSLSSNATPLGIHLHYIGRWPYTRRVKYTIHFKAYAKNSIYNSYQNNVNKICITNLKIKVVYGPLERSRVGLGDGQPTLNIKNHLKYFLNNYWKFNKNEVLKEVT